MTKQYKWHQIHPLSPKLVQGKMCEVHEVYLHPTASKKKLLLAQESRLYLKAKLKSMLFLLPKSICLNVVFKSCDRFRRHFTGLRATPLNQQLLLHKGDCAWGDEPSPPY